MCNFFMNLLSIAVIFLIISCTGCKNNEDKNNHFQFVETLFTKSENKITHSNHVLSVEGVTPLQLERHRAFFKTKGFDKWSHLDSSEGFLLKANQQMIFTGKPEKPITYTISNTRCGKYTPIILLDEKTMILYCVLSTDLGG